MEVSWRVGHAEYREWAWDPWLIGRGYIFALDVSWMVVLQRLYYHRLLYHQSRSESFQLLERLASSLLSY